MADAIITAQGTTTAIVPEVWSGVFTQNLSDKIVFNSLIRRDYEGEIANLGDTVNIPTIANVTAQNLPDGATGSASSISATVTPLVINKRAYVDFLVSSEAKLQSIPFMDYIRTLGMQALIRKMQSDIVTLIVPSASAPDHTTSYDSSQTLADADLLEALDLEKTANWPDDGRYLVTGGLQYNDLLEIDKLYLKTVSGIADVSSGKMNAPIYGHSCDWTNAVGNTTFMFHDSFMQMAIQQGLTVKVFDPGVNGQRGFRVNMDVLYGIKQIHNDRVISIS